MHQCNFCLLVLPFWARTRTKIFLWTLEYINTGRLFLPVMNMNSLPSKGSMTTLAAKPLLSASFPPLPSWVRCSWSMVLLHPRLCFQLLNFPPSLSHPFFKTRFALIVSSQEKDFRCPLTEEASHKKTSEEKA